jgi:RHS repeat-associated protein
VIRWIGCWGGSNRQINAVQVATSTYTYDSLSRLAALSHGRIGTGIAGPMVGSNGKIEYTYQYDLRNRITQLTSVEGTANYSYDGEDQLLGANYSPVSTVSAALQNESYGHDLNGNRWQRSRGSNAYDVTTGTNNQVTDDGEYTYTYDGEGNRITQFRKSPISGASDNYTFYKYDQATEAAERLARIKAEGGSKLWPLGTQPKLQLTKVIFRDAANETTSNIISQVWHSFDVLDRRMTRQNVNASGTVLNYDNYVYDGWDAVADYYITPSNAGYYEVFRYFWAPSDKAGDTSILVSQEWNYGAGYQNRFMLNEATEAAERLARMKAEGGSNRHWKDVLGMNSSLTDILQRQHYVYDAYGKLAQVVAAGGTGTNPLTRYQYTSQEFDTTTGLQYSNHRFLHVQTATWMTQDPLEFGAGDTNLSRYVGNNSVNATDPSGLKIAVCNIDEYLHLYGLSQFKTSQYKDTKALLYEGNVEYWGGSLEAEILTKMIASDFTFEVDQFTLKNLEFHVDARVKIVDATSKFVASGFSPITGGEYYMSGFAPAPYPGLNLLTFGPVSYTTSLGRIFESKNANVGCQSAQAICQAQGVIFAEIQFIAKNILQYRGVYQPTKAQLESAVIEAKDLMDNKLNNHADKSDMKIWDYNIYVRTQLHTDIIIPGDGIVIESASRTPKKGQEGENLIYIGNDLFWGFDLKDKSNGKTDTYANWLSWVSEWNNNAGIINNIDTRTPTSGLSGVKK